MHARQTSHGASPNLGLLAALGSLLTNVWVLLGGPTGGLPGVIPGYLTLKIYIKVLRSTTLTFNYKKHIKTGPTYKAH